MTNTTTGQNNSREPSPGLPGQQDADEEHGYTGYSVSRSGPSPAPSTGITVVSQHSTSRLIDPEMSALSKIPRFYPILKSSIGGHDDISDSISPAPFTALFANVEVVTESDTIPYQLAAADYHAGTAPDNVHGGGSSAADANARRTSY